MIIKNIEKNNYLDGIILRVELSERNASYGCSFVTPSIDRPVCQTEYANILFQDYYELKDFQHAINSLVDKIERDLHSGVTYFITEKG